MTSSGPQHTASRGAVVAENPRRESATSPADAGSIRHERRVAAQHAQIPVVKRQAEPQVDPA